jgi:hypothetical protein
VADGVLVLATFDVVGVEAFTAEGGRLGKGMGTNGFPSWFAAAGGAGATGADGPGPAGAAGPGCVGPSFAFNLATATLSRRTRKVLSISPVIFYKVICLL